MRVERKIGKSWSVTIGHGCNDAEQMKAWVDARNQTAGARIFRVVGLPPEPKPVVPRTSLSLLELAIAERTLGLHRSNAVSQNSFEPLNDTDQRIVDGMIAQGWMSDSQGFYMTVKGLEVLQEQRAFGLSILG